MSSFALVASTTCFEVALLSTITVSETSVWRSTVAAPVALRLAITTLGSAIPPLRSAVTPLASAELPQLGTTVATAQMVAQPVCRFPSHTSSSLWRSAVSLWRALVVVAIPALFKALILMLLIPKLVGLGKGLLGLLFGYRIISPSVTDGQCGPAELTLVLGLSRIPGVETSVGSTMLGRVQSGRPRSRLTWSQ